MGRYVCEDVCGKNVTVSFGALLIVYKNDFKMKDS